MRADTRPRKIKPPVPLPISGQLGGHELRNVLGLGALGFVYRVTDREAELDLAVKEYLPHHLAQRDGATGVAPRGPAEAELFAQGLRFFINEGKLLMQLDHPSLIRVHQVWEENGTAYLLMDMSTGRNLVDTRHARWRAPSEAALRGFIETMLGPLELLHANQLQHRDLAPPNIMVEANGTPVLMDLGSPRRAISLAANSAVGPREGYAPPELYPKDEKLPRGAWTDLYSLGATLHFMVTGRPPPAAPEREAGDRAGFALQRPDHRFSLDFLSVVDWMLALQPQDRPQDVAQLREALAGTRPVPERHAPTRGELRAVRWRARKHWLWIGLGLLVAAGIGFWVWRLWKSGLIRLPAWLS